MKQIAAVHADALAVFRKFYGRRGLFFLDSSRAGPESRHSYIGADPYAVASGRGFGNLRKQFQKYRGQSGRGPSTLLRASPLAVGYIGYGGDFHFGFYKDVLEFKPALSSSLKAPHKTIPIRYTSNFTRDAYMSAVQRALEHIGAGDIYQINLSRRVHAALPSGQPIHPLSIYTALRQCAPSPFTAYYQAGQNIILSSSPERFLCLKGRGAQVKPMKGTRPRGKTPAEDQRLKRQLRTNAKEIAELLMVTDLERNDLGRVCRYGSVKVKARRTIETYKSVFQATATIEGQLRPDKDGFDLLEATFPSGSVTGCPKIEAMKIIQRLETVPRGLYTGALGYITADGDMDFSALIRAIFIQGKNISFHVGGGIVADSNPEAEFEETCVKAKALQQALEKAP